MAGDTAVTPDMAVRLGKLCGNGPGLWLRLQANYDAWKASKRLKHEIAKIPMGMYAHVDADSGKDELDSQVVRKLQG